MSSVFVSIVFVLCFYFDVLCLSVCIVLFVRCVVTLCVQNWPLPRLHLHLTKQHRGLGPQRAAGPAGPTGTTGRGPLGQSVVWEQFLFLWKFV